MAQSFLTFYGKKYRKTVTLSDDAKQVLQNHTWPGNVRELENLVQGLVVTCKHGLVGVRDLAGIRPLPPCGADEGQYALPSIEGRSLKSIMKEVETAVIEKGMQRYGSISELSRQFQMDRSTIFRKVKEIEATRRN